MRTLKLIFTLLFVCISYISLAQFQVTGKVLDTFDTPILGATVSIFNPENKSGQLTDAEGNFDISVSEGSYTIEIRYLGFEPYKSKIDLNENLVYDIGEIRLKEGAEQLQSVEIVGRARTDYNSDYSFSSTKIAIKNKELPQAVATITKELINDRQAFQIADAVKTSSSVTHTGFYNHFNIRGLIQAEDGQLINGLRTRQYYFLQPITSHIERIEVIKGPSSVTFSSVDPGGSVNLVTKKPLKEKRSEISATAVVLVY